MRNKMDKKDVLQALALSTVIVVVCVFVFDLPVGINKSVEKTSTDLTQLLVTQVTKDKESLELIRQQERLEKKERREKERRSRPVVALKPWEKRST